MPRDATLIHADSLLKILPRVPAGVQEAIDARERLAVSLREAQEERDLISVTPTPDDWRSWRKALDQADVATASLDAVIEAMAELSTAVDNQIVHAIVESAEVVHGILVDELASLLADARKAAESFRGAPIPGGDALPHLPPAKQAAWGVLEAATGRYARVREGERHLRELVGGGEPNHTIAEFRDVAHPLLWGSLPAWRARVQSGRKPGPANGRPMDYVAWLASLPPGLVWLPTAAEEGAAYAALRVLTTKEAALGAFIPQR